MQTSNASKGFSNSLYEKSLKVTLDFDLFTVNIAWAYFSIEAQFSSNGNAIALFPVKMKNDGSKNKRKVKYALEWVTAKILLNLI